jgi:hypothetical protein
MIKLFSLKQQKKDGEATPKSGNQKKASAAQLRITKGETFSNDKNYLTKLKISPGKVSWSIKTTYTNAQCKVLHLAYLTR